MAKMLTQFVAHPWNPVVAAVEQLMELLLSDALHFCQVWWVPSKVSFSSQIFTGLRRFRLSFSSLFIQSLARLMLVFYIIVLLEEPWTVTESDHVTLTCFPAERFDSTQTSWRSPPTDSWICHRKHSALLLSFICQLDFRSWSCFSEMKRGWSSSSVVRHFIWMFFFFVGYEPI